MKARFVVTADVPAGAAVEDIRDWISLGLAYAADQCKARQGSGAALHRALAAATVEAEGPSIAALPARDGVTLQAAAPLPGREGWANQALPPEPEGPT